MAQSPLRDRGALAELIVPSAAILFTLYYMWSVRDGPFEAKFSAYFIGSALVAISAIFLTARLWRLVRSGLPNLPPGHEPIPFGITMRRVALVVLTLSYALLLSYGLGFTLSSFIFLSLGIVILSGLEHALRAVGVAATLSSLGYLIFIVAFDTRFPEGPIERLLAPLFG